MTEAASYRICARCIMDNASDPKIEFDEGGVCNHCHRYDRLAKNVVVSDDETELRNLAERIKATGQGRRYDCVVGISGGVDSTYVAYLAKRLGLRALTVSVDNGWDDPRAQENVKNAVEKLGFDFHHWVLDWEEFKDLQLAYLRASVVDIEMATDHAILAALFRLAGRHGVKYILTGANVVTEGGVIVESWLYEKNDLTNLRDIHRRYGSVALRTYPTLGLWGLVYYHGMKGIRCVSPLNYTRYVKSEAKETLKGELGWQDYGAKHHESVFTRFYQTYILPRKFGFDKRRGHLSTLINSGQMTREAALEEMKRPPCSEELLAQDKRLVVEKLGLSEEEFEAIMREPIRSHYDFKTGFVWLTVRRVHRWLRERKRLRG